MVKYSKLKYSSTPKLELILFSTAGGASCSLPSSWSGAWFESGVPGTVAISARNGSIEHKGNCIKKLRYSTSHFIFQSSKEGERL